jgi:hypothetical protein
MLSVGRVSILLPLASALLTPNTVGFESARGAQPLFAAKFESAILPEGGFCRTASVSLALLSALVRSIRLFDPSIDPACIDWTFNPVASPVTVAFLTLLKSISVEKREADFEMKAFVLYVFELADDGSGSFLNTPVVFALEDASCLG